MSHTPHALTEEFPDFVKEIGQLRQTDSHFAKMVEEYQEVNGEIHRVETDVEPTSDAHATELRRRRMALKDEIYASLKQHAAAV